MYSVQMYFEGQVWTKVASKERYAGGVWWQNQVSTDFVKFRTKSCLHSFLNDFLGREEKSFKFYFWEISDICLRKKIHTLGPLLIILKAFLDCSPTLNICREFELLCANWLTKKLYHKSIRLIQVLFIHIARMLWDSSRRRCPWQCFDEFKTWIKLTVQYAEKEFVLVHHRNPNIEIQVVR